MMTNCVQEKDPGGVSSQEETVQDEKQQKVTDNDEIFVVVEEMPQFPGGQEALMKYISENVHYPKEAQETVSYTHLDVYKRQQIVLSLILE